MDSFELIDEDPLEPSETPMYLSKWMSKLHPSTPLIRLLLPGSNCSSSFDLKSPKIKVPFCRTQTKSILEQLQMGIRFLDFRFSIKAQRKPKSNSSKKDVKDEEVVSFHKYCEGIFY